MPERRDEFIAWVVSRLSPEERERALRMKTEDLRRLWGFGDGTAQSTEEDQ